MLQGVGKTLLSPSYGRTDVPNMFTHKPITYFNDSRYDTTMTKGKGRERKKIKHTPLALSLLLLTPDRTLTINSRRPKGLFGNKSKMSLDGTFVP